MIERQCRNSSFEMLRIISMFGIVMGHLVGQTELNVRCQGITGYLVNFLGGSSRISVNLFLMIGCWFLINTQMTAKKVLRIYLPLHFYSIVISLACFICYPGEVSVNQLLSGFFPFLRFSLWFLTTYIVLMFVQPFLNTLVYSLNEKQGEILIIILFLINSFMSTILGFQDSFLSSVSWFVFIYLFIAIWKKKILEINKARGMILLILAIIMYGLMIGAKVIFQPSGNIVYRITSQYLADYKSIPNFCISLFIFTFFAQLQWESSIINTAAKNILAVYIIHQVPAFFMILWNRILNIDSWEIDKYIPLKIIMSAIIVYVIASLIEQCRKLLIERYVVRLNVYERLCKLIEENYFSKIRVIIR